MSAGEKKNEKATTNIYQTASIFLSTAIVFVSCLLISDVFLFVPSRFYFNLF